MSKLLLQPPFAENEASEPAAPIARPPTEAVVVFAVMPEFSRDGEVGEPSGATVEVGVPSAMGSSWMDRFDRASDHLFDAR
mmetsp:Transcript_3200/g.4413  ORF Transcript_3200/g.4413 Transcript_3200/m.4413 type:complete len:81 (-) Transcript_3200:208-450(-)